MTQMTQTRLAMRAWWSKLRRLVSRDRLDEDLRAELDTHLQMEVEARLDRGMSEDAALEAARRQFGNRTRIEEASREAWMFIRLETLVQDIRYGLRVLRRSPGFALTAMLVIALGVGANTAAFTLLDHVLLRPLPFNEPQRLVTLFESQPSNGIPRTQTSPPNFIDWRDMSSSFDSMGAYFSILFAVNLSGQGDPMRLDTAIVNADVFRTLGVQPETGRVFTADDDRPGAANVAVLSHALAMALFGGSSTAVGRTISLDNLSHTIVGVMPPVFAFPSRDAQLWRPLRFSPPLLASRSNHVLYAVARLRSGVSLDEARADMDVIAKRLQQAYPKENGKSEIGVVMMRDMMSPQSRLLVLAVFGASFCMMLIACTNLANLLFARALVRRQEIAVRIAIGAARHRLLHQLLTETLLLALAGGAIGLLFAAGTTPLLARLVPAALGLGAVPEVNWRVFGFAAALVVFTSIAFGVGPAWQAYRTSDSQALHSRTGVGNRGGRLRSALVLAEVAGTVTLLVVAGLLVKALLRVQAIDPGFRTEGILTLRTALPSPKYASAGARRTFYSRVLDDARALPGVTSVAYVSYHPMERASGRLDVLAPGVADDPLSAPQAVVHYATPGYFDTLGIPIRAGRDFTEQDGETSPRVTVIGESLAERLWPGQDPIGRQVKAMRADWTIVGVAGSILVRSLENAIDPQIYFPSEQLGTTSIYYAPKDLVICAAGDPLALVPALRRVIRESDPDQAVSDVKLLKDIVGAQTAPRRDQLIVLGALAAIAFVLAGVGIHGLLSFTVSSRSQEIGVRVALGAARSRILSMFLRQALVLGLAGIAVAVPLAYAAARGMGALLFGVEPSDPLIYLSAALVAVAMTLAGSLRPAIRAAVIDPAVTIRTE
jgi:predicted permease